MRTPTCQKAWHIQTRGSDRMIYMSNCCVRDQGLGQSLMWSGVVIGIRIVGEATVGAIEVAMDAKAGLAACIEWTAREMQQLLDFGKLQEEMFRSQESAVEGS